MGVLKVRVTPKASKNSPTTPSSAPAAPAAAAAAAATSTSSSTAASSSSSSSSCCSSSSSSSLPMSFLPLKRHSLDFLAHRNYELEEHHVGQSRFQIGSKSVVAHFKS